ncbi:hypothetical protein EB796_011279 [Bugula neritina]|uniref:Uncharacterized protein n=1 Tax=Bugula neritina TaxID=10212 RepID=A0A7J7JYN0_BUGNE|nr:hypothetical protein EB796_011279 [Bugula neritina]
MLIHYLSIHLFPLKINYGVAEGSESSEDEFDGVMMASKRIQIYMQTSSGHVLAMYRPVLFHKKVCKILVYLK